MRGIKYPLENCLPNPDLSQLLYFSFFVQLWISWSSPFLLQCSRNYIPASHRHEQHILTDNPYFKVTSLDLNDPLHIYTDKYESFILYYCINGEARIDEGVCTISEGEWVLIPAGYKDFILSPSQNGTKLLEVYIVKQEEEDSYIEDGCHHHHHDHE